MAIDKLTHDNGQATYQGKTYVLIRPANIDGQADTPHYSALAICPANGLCDDNLYDVYRITWHPSEAWLARAKQCSEDGDYCDEGDACDWDDPDDVVKTGSGYDMEDDRVI